jgi:putative ABC transport system permease protein
VIAWLGSSLRRLRDERLTALGLVALVLVTAFLAAAAPRLLDRVADDALLATIKDAHPANSNVQLIREDRYHLTGQGLFGQVTSIQGEVHELLPAPLAALVSEQAWTIETGRWRMAEIEGDPAFMRLRIQPDAAERISLVDGRWPTGETGEIEDPLSVNEPAVRHLTVFEVAVAAPAAERLSLELGQIVTLPADTTDPLVGRNDELRIAAQIVGTYEVNDEDDPWWLGSTDLAQPTIRFAGGDNFNIDVTGLLAPEAYPAYMLETALLHAPLRYTFRNYVDPVRLDASHVDALLPELRRLEAALPSTVVRPNQETGLRTGLRAILDGFVGRWTSASAILTVGAIGPATVAAGALGLVAVLAAQRRRSALALARGRGASLGQVIAAVVAEGLLMGVPAASLAVAAALLFIPADPVRASLIGAAAVAAVVVVLLVLATMPALSGPSFGPARDASVPRRPSARRLLFEGLVVVLAVGGALLLRERGVRGASSTGQLAAADPFVAAVPALLGVAAGLIAIRLYPYPMRFLAWLARRRRDLVPVLAMRHSAQGGGAPILIALLATAAIGAFSSAVLLHIDRGAAAAAWREVGADYRIESVSSSLGRDFDAAALPGVEASAVAWSGFVAIGPGAVRVEFIALSASTYDEVVTGTPADPGLPVDLFADAPDVIPVVVSRSVDEDPGGVHVGDTFPLIIQAYSFEARVVGIRDDLPALTSGGSFVIASRDQLKARFPGAPLVPSMAFLKAPPDAEPAIREKLATDFPVGLALRSRAAEAAAIRTSPTSQAVVAGITLAALVAVAYAILAIAAALALAGASRAVEVAHLRTLGLTNRQAAGLVIAEHGPTVVAAFAAGLGLGLGMFLALRQGLGLEALVGSAAEVPLAIEPLHLGLVFGGIVAVVVLGLILGTLMQRGAAPVAAVRRGFE